MQRKGNTYTRLTGILTSTATTENSVEISQKSKNRLPFDPAMLLLPIYPKENKPIYQSNTCAHMFIVALSTIARYGMSLSTRQWTN